MLGFLDYWRSDMAFIGNTNTTQGFIPAIDYFSGNGSTVAFTLSRPVASVAQVQANISNVPQNPSSAFSVSGNTITFTSAPPSGTNNIYVYYTSPITQVIAPGQGTVTSESFGTIVNFTTTGNTVLGDASTDTLNVGNGGLVKDASGNVTMAGTLTTSSRGIAKASLPTGSVLQVVQAVDSTTRNTSANYPTSTGVSASITPSSATSKILVLVDCATWLSVGTGTNANKIGIYGIYRNATQILNQRFSLGNTSNWTDLFSPLNLQYLDSPATTSSTTYTLYWGRYSGTYDNNLYMNDGGPGGQQTTQITLMEIAA
jgi:hypothetical protein